MSYHHSVALAVLVVISACAPVEKTPRISVDSTAPRVVAVPEARVDTASRPVVADSCPPAQPGTPDDIRRDSAFGNPGGNWADLRTLRSVAWSIDVPASAKFSGTRADALPDCLGCSVWVSTWPDTHSVVAHVDSILKVEAKRDSANKVNAIGEFNDYFGPASWVHTATDSALFLTGGCGDCLSGSFFFQNGGQIAEVGYTADYGRDRAHRECETRRIALTFRWNKP